MTRRFIFLFLIIFLAPAFAHAGLIINEVMYDTAGTDTNHEWIEVYNNGSSAFSLTGVKFNDGANHGLNPPGTNGSTGSMSIPAGGYAIFSGNATTFATDYPDYEGTIIDTVMALANTGDTLSLVADDDSMIDLLTYTSAQGATGDGNSLQAFGSDLVSATPTPGKVNTRESIVDDEEPQEEDEDEEEQSTEEILPSYAGTITVREPVTAGVPTEFQTLIVNPERKVVYPGRYVWSMGDGASYEYKDGKILNHIYESEGEYVVVLEYYHSRGAFVPDVVKKKTIHVGTNQISIATGATGSIQVKNTNKDEINLSGWIISSGGRTFKFPKNTIVAKEKSISISSKVSGIQSSTGSQIALYHPSGYLASAYPSVATPKTNTRARSSVVTIGDADELMPAEEGEFIGVSAEFVPEVLASATEELPKSLGPVDPGLESNTALTAAAVEAVPDPSPFKLGFNVQVIYYILFAILLALVVFIARRVDRKKKSERELEADEFTIVE